jgi:L-threonylcarbamoyladenylate synthase
VHISSINQLEKWAREIPEYAIDLARAFWPGPMTLILRRTDIAKNFITGGQETVGLRVPNDPIALALIQEFERISDSAIAAPSANRFGQVSSTSSTHVGEELGEYLSEFDLVLDGGHSQIGIESTIIDCTGVMPIILRAGAVTSDDMEDLLGLTSEGSATSQIRFSGSFNKHYSPKCKVILDALPEPGDAFLALSEVSTPPGVMRIGAPDSLDSFARMLYSIFRVADSQGFKRLIVMQPHGGGIAVAIRERLEKAAYCDEN